MTASRDGRFGSHGNKVDHGRARPDSERWPELSLRKVDEASVPYGESISRNGRIVWAAYHSGELVVVGATRDEARAKYRDWHVSQGMSAEGDGQKS